MHVAIPCPRCKHYTSVELGEFGSKEHTVFNASFHCDYCKSWMYVEIGN